MHTRFGTVATQDTGSSVDDAPPLMVLHGGGPGCHAASDFAAVSPMLTGRRLVLVDLPGYGRSPLAPSARPRFSRYAQLLGAVLDELEIDTCDVLTQSLGGIAAMALAAYQPQRVRRIVAIGSQPLRAPRGVQVDPGLGSRAREAYYGCDLQPERLRETVLRLEWSDLSRVPPDLLAARFSASTTPAALAVVADPSLLGAPEDLSWLPTKVRAATLILWGEQDPFGSPRYGEWLAGLLPHGTQAVVAGAAHHPQSEYPREVATLVAAHLDQEWT